MKRLLFVGVAVFVLLTVLVIKYTYDWAPKNAKNNGSEFVRQCDSLNGKQFTFENISTVNGFYDLNGRDRVIEEQVEQFAKQMNEQNTLRIYKDSWFKGPNIKYSWICEIKYNNETTSISSTANFYQTD